MSTRMGTCLECEQQARAFAMFLEFQRDPSTENAWQLISWLGNSRRNVVALDRALTDWALNRFGHAAYGDHDDAMGAKVDLLLDAPYETET